MAFEQALLLKKQHILEAIYEVNHEVINGAILIVRLTSMKGPQGLLNSSEIDTQTIHGAFICSSRCGRVDILEVLLEADHVSEKLLDEGFQCAARLGSIDSVEFLFSKTILSTRSINMAFENAGSIDVTKFLYNNADIPSETIIAAFKTAIGFETTPNPFENNCDAIAIFLHIEKCISMETINHAFLIAASSRRSDVVECMRDDYRLTSASVSKVFSTAIDDRCFDMVKSSYNGERLPQELVNRKFLDAAYNGDPEIVGFLVDKSCISSSVMQEAFMIAAERNRKGVVKLLGTRIAYPLSVLSEALDATTNKILKKFLRMKVNM